jgi:putative hydrolase of the HAD superfamily
MIVIFDLDDTLYDELTYVRSGFRAVANWGASQLGLNAEKSYSKLISIFETEGRGRVFDQWLGDSGSVREAVRVYRHHNPSIVVWDAAVRAMNKLRDHPLYLVTDGHKVAQANKIAALGIASRFRHAYLTHRYGLAHAKPSTHCFRLIQKRERCDWSEMAYVGDNPSKDFVNLNTLGVPTVRVLTGQHREVVAKPGFDAKHQIRSLDELPDLLVIEQGASTRNSRSWAQRQSGD